ncbi:hypothetical protein G6F37_012461 [Rhizopus arrhizus]|nr:hypothetical protein G6F38_012508 [Rhizopus arrhizus]KAG1143480.1 hypothetical protein G6F37_012461 [Rhizopus arrhizus]
MSYLLLFHSVRTTTSTHARAVIRELFPSSGQSDATIRFDCAFRYMAFDIPSSAFTPWWRLLHDSLPVASTLHRRNLTSCASPICRICHSDIEDTFHFVVGCSLKCQFLSSVLSLFRLTDQFPDATSVWSALAILSSPDNRYTVCPDPIRPLEFAFSSL